MIQAGRIRRLSQNGAGRGRYVLYWMQQSQRASGNPALELAVQEANRAGLPVVVTFGLMDDYPDASLRHYAFMLEGLQETARTLRRRGVAFVLRRQHPPAVALALARDATLLVADRGYLRHQVAWRDEVAAAAPCPVVQVEADVVVPVEVASDRREMAARTLRPRLHRVLDDYLVDLEEVAVARRADDLGLASDVDPENLDAVLDDLGVDRRIGRVRRFKGGTGEARRRLEAFVEAKLCGYAGARSEPAAYQCSMLSPYLHFGQISPVEVAQAVRRAGGGADRASYLDELIVRRELSMNFVHFEPAYDRYECLPGWARATLDDHRADPREHRYGVRELEAADTHDPFWNTAMREMRDTGYMHNYMRMYWAKKILEWSPSPEESFETALTLNNRWFLDGRDPNSYANVAWTFGLHDRPWTERAVFGKVRYMNANGLKRKFDMPAYGRAVDALVEAERG